jgi:hypothetical protein
MAGGEDPGHDARRVMLEMEDTNDSGLPEITDEMMREALATTRGYTIVILKAGPNFSAQGERSQEVDNIVWEHGRRNFALRAAGLLSIVCPVADGSGVNGLAIFNADPDRVRAIMTEDPGVKAGVFTFDIHPTRSFPGDCLPGSDAAAHPED